MPPSTVSVLRVAPSTNTVLSDQLRTALLHHFSTQEATAQPGAPQHTLTITNKYFTALVSLPDIDRKYNTDDDDGLLAVSEDGVMLVFEDQNDTTNSSSFDALQAIHERAEQNETAGDLLRLCVGVHFTSKRQYPSEKEYEQEYSRRILWCLDRGYEYVEADLSSEGISSGHNERDKEGFARIVEAISGTVWSSAVMGSSKKAELKQSYQSTLQSDNTGKDYRENQYKPPSFPISKEQQKKDKVREEKARNALLSESEAQSDESNINAQYLDGDGNALDEETLSQRRKELEEERKLDNLEGAIREAKSIRELSLSGTLTDEQRRQRAGDAAVLLMNMMGLGDESDDESSVGLNDDDEKKEETGGTSQVNEAE